MRLGTCLLFKGRTLQGAHPKLAYFCSATVVSFFATVDKKQRRMGRQLMSALPLPFPKQKLDPPLTHVKICCRSWDKWVVDLLFINFRCLPAATLKYG